MEEKTILTELFNDFRQNRVIIHSKDGLWKYKTKLFVNLEGEEDYKEDYPFSINIPNFDLLEKKTENYLSKARNFYNEDKDYYEIEDSSYDKHLLFFLFVNMTMYDANDIYNFFDKRSKMLESSKNFVGESFSGHYSDGEKIDFDIKVKIERNRSNMEAPLKFDVVLQKENQSFILPTINFGIAGEQAYIASVQNFHTKQEGELVKTLDRYFRKVNKDIDSESIEANVSPNAVVSMAFFFKFLEQNNIKSVEVPDYMPLRYFTNLESRKIKAIHTAERIDEIYDTMDRDQFNMTNKLMYLMLRMGKHFDNLQVDYDEIRNQMEVIISDNLPTQKDNIIHKVYNSTDFGKTKTYSQEKTL
ncbi:MAG: hypothetical protein ACI4R8_04290 [Candidatus Caccovivens sp.]